VISKPFKKKENTETSLIEQFYYPKKGPGQLWEALAAEIEKLGGKILKNHSVKTLNIQNKKIIGIGIETPDGIIDLKADYYISTMPIKDLVNGMGEDVPNTVKEVALNLPYRDFMTVGVLVNKLKLQNKTKHKTLGNIVPDCWIYIQERDVKLGRLQIFNNWSPYMVKDPENTVWVGLEYFCNEGDEFWNMPDNEFTQFALDELQKIGIIEKEDVLDTVRIKVKKAYPAYFGAYSEFHIVREYLDSIDNLYCIGRNGMHRYNNMDHSMLTAIEAVNCIKDTSLGKSCIWNVNTEQEYHEEK
jgi:protoporphyrinogen oxidase